MFKFTTASPTRRWPVALLALLSIATATAQESDSIRSGTLLFEVAEGDAVEVPRVSTDVQVEVSGAIAHVQVRQRFTNPSDLWASAVYAFPLPQNAVLDHLRTEVNQQVVDEVHRQVDARELQAQAGAARHEPRQALLLQAPLVDVAPRGVIDVTIGYLQLVDAGARHQLRVPLASNLQPPARVAFTRISQQTAPAFAARTAHQLNVRVTLEGVTQLSSAHHSIAVEGSERQRVLVRSTDGGSQEDFELSWQPTPGRYPSAVPGSNGSHAGWALLGVALAAGSLLWMMRDWRRWKITRGAP